MQKRSGLGAKRGSSGIEGILGLGTGKKKGVYSLRIGG